MPDPDETATATAEADAGAVTVADPNQIVEPEETPGAAAEQEATDQAEAKPDEKAGAEQEQEGETEGGDPLEQFTGQLAEFRKANPEAAERMAKALQEPEEAVDPLSERERAVAAKEAKFEGQGAVGQAFQEVNAVGSGGRQTLDTSITAFATQFAEGVNGRIVEGEQKVVPENVSQAMTAVRQQAEQYTYNATAAGSFLQAKNALMSSDATLHLTADELKAVREMGWQAALTNQGQAYSDLFAIFLTAAQRAAPKRVLAQAKEEREKATAGLKDIANVIKTFPGNAVNRAALNADGTSSATQFSNFDDAEQAWLDGKITDQQYKEARKKFNLPDVAR